MSTSGRLPQADDRPRHGSQPAISPEHGCPGCHSDAAKQIRHRRSPTTLRPSTRSVGSFALRGHDALSCHSSADPLRRQTPSPAVLYEMRSYSYTSESPSEHAFWRMAIVTFHPGRFTHTGLGRHPQLALPQHPLPASHAKSVLSVTRHPMPYCNFPAATIKSDPEGVSPYTKHSSSCNVCTTAGGNPIDYASNMRSMFKKACRLVDRSILVNVKMGGYSRAGRAECTLHTGAISSMQNVATGPVMPRASLPQLLDRWRCHTCSVHRLAAPTSSQSTRLPGLRVTMVTARNLLDTKRITFWH